MVQRAIFCYEMIWVWYELLQVYTWNTWKLYYMIYWNTKWLIHVYETCLVIMFIHVYWLLYVFYMANMLVNMCLGIWPNWVGICYIYLPKLWLNGKLNSMLYELTKLKCLLGVFFLFLVNWKLVWVGSLSELYHTIHRLTRYFWLV